MTIGSFFLKYLGTFDGKNLGMLELDESFEGLCFMANLRLVEGMFELGRLLLKNCCSFVRFIPVYAEISLMSCWST